MFRSEALMLLVLVPLVFLVLFAASVKDSLRYCRNQPGDPAFPTAAQFARLNTSINGRLVKVIPSGQFCKGLGGGCTDAEWNSGVFLSDVPGAMIQINWEQDYSSVPPSLCFRNTSVCGQGSVPIYGVNATVAAHIQAGVRFAQANKLRVAIKASGHDYLGRSTAKNSLLLWTRHFQDITFHDSFRIEGKDRGSAVTVGSGVGLRTLYQATKAKGKVFVGGTAQTVVAAGGYIQGAGHSALGPMFGLAADNALEFQIVIASGDLITANEVQNSDLFWALRGGGAGSWGVVISATLRTYPTFDAVHHLTVISAHTTAQVGRLATLHAQHIFDWDELRASQYFYFTTTPPTFTFKIDTIVPNASLNTTNAALAPFLSAVTDAGFLANVSSEILGVNDLLSEVTDNGAQVLVMGSRLIPADVYSDNPAAVGETYQKLFDADPPSIDMLGHLVAGGQVSENAHIDSAITPKWRTAKTHLIVEASWADSTHADEVEAVRHDLTHNKVPILEALAGPGSGSYSNEADLREPDFQTTFFGPNYARLSLIKEIYDPHALFIVGAGVGSEKWDAEGLCRV